jgi:hypothetical protein
MQRSGRPTPLRRGLRAGEGRAGRRSSSRARLRAIDPRLGTTSPITAFACISPAIATLHPVSGGIRSAAWSDPWIARMDAPRVARVRSFICAWAATAIPTGRDGRSAGRRSRQRRERGSSLEAPPDALEAIAAESSARWRRSARHAQRYAQADGRGLPASRATGATPQRLVVMAGLVPAIHLFDLL